MTIEKFDYDKHAVMVNTWGEKHDFPLPPKNFLSNVGFVVNETACGFLYTTNSDLAWIEWVFGNPEKTREERTLGIDLLMKLLEATAKEAGCRAIFTSAGSAAYRAVLERNKFDPMETTVSHHLKVLEV